MQKWLSSVPVAFENENKLYECDDSAWENINLFDKKIIIIVMSHISSHISLSFFQLYTYVCVLCFHSHTLCFIKKNSYPITNNNYHIRFDCFCFRKACKKKLKIFPSFFHFPHSLSLDGINVLYIRHRASFDYLKVHDI
jgi:hypothetical protein